MPRVHKRLTGSRLPREFDELVRVHPPRVIHDESDFANTQEVVDALTSVPTLSAGQGEYLETLTVLMEAYEHEHHRIDTSGLSPQDMLKFLMEQRDMTVADLGKLVGSSSLASMILNGDRDLSKAKILLLAKHFGVEPGAFL